MTSSPLVPVLRPLAKRSNVVRFLYSQFYDPQRSAPPALAPTLVPFPTPETVRQEVLDNLELRVRYNWPFGYKKGATISFEQIRTRLPKTLALYRSLPAFLSPVLGGQTVECTKDDDLSSCSVLVYEDPGDTIFWHYDNNFYRGRHYTVLLPIVIRGSDTRYEFMEWETNKVASLELEENQLMAFEGDKIFHRATPQTRGLRIVLSMTYTTDALAEHRADTARRFKDVAYFGLDAVGLGKLERLVFGERATTSFMRPSSVDKLVGK